MHSNRFSLSSSDCELLLELENALTVEATARALNKDASVVSRQLNRIAQSFPSALEKRGGRWVLTETGRRLNGNSRDAIRTQQLLTERQSTLRIGTNREFAARIIAPQILEFTELFPKTKILLYSYESGTEQALLNGKVDIGIDCDRPTDPEIGYKQLIPEPIVAVAAKSFLKKYKQQIADLGLYQTPHLACERLLPDKIFMESENKLNIVAYFNDIASTRAACVSGLGWALLPRYTILEEIDNKQLYVLREKQSGLSKYGVWWSRSRFNNKEILAKISNWLKQQSL